MRWTNIWTSQLQRKRPLFKEGYRFPELRQDMQNHETKTACGSSISLVREHDVRLALLLLLILFILDLTLDDSHRHECALRVVLRLFLPAHFHYNLQCLGHRRISQKGLSSWRIDSQLRNGLSNIPAQQTTSCAIILQFAVTKALIVMAS
jgi:hypothetical protein